MYTTTLERYHAGLSLPTSEFWSVGIAPTDQWRWSVGAICTDQRVYGAHTLCSKCCRAARHRRHASLLHNVKIVTKCQNDFRSFLLSFLHPLPAALHEHLAQKSLLRCHAMAAAGRARAAIIGHACHDHFHPVLKSDVTLWQYICAGSRASSLAAHPTHALSRRLFACPRASAPAAQNSKVAAG